jgi:NTP pyrophosphatase (non-canonical NTP hydrolase)
MARPEYGRSAHAMKNNQSNHESKKLEAIAMEIADVQIYLLRLADVLGIDVPESVRKKIEINESRF